jgi:hypothetical protein
MSKWNSDAIFRRTWDRKKLYDDYVENIKQLPGNITNCMPAVRVGYVRAFDEKQDLWCAKDFWRFALEDKSLDAEDQAQASGTFKSAFRHKFQDITTLSSIENQYVKLQNHWLSIKFDGYLVILYRAAHGGWAMKTRKGVELYPDDAFLIELAENQYLPPVLVGELLTGWGEELCAVQDRLKPEKRGLNRNKNFETLNKIFYLKWKLTSLQDLFYTLKDEASFTHFDEDSLKFTDIHTTITDYLQRRTKVTLETIKKKLKSKCAEIDSYLRRIPQSPHEEKLTKIKKKYGQISATPSPWHNLRVIVFAFPTLLRTREENRTDTFEMQYMTGLSIMEQTVHLHPHIGVCRFEKFDYKSVAFDYFQSAVKMGLEGPHRCGPSCPVQLQRKKERAHTLLQDETQDGDQAIYRADEGE